MATSEDPLEEEWEYWRRELGQFVDGLFGAAGDPPPQADRCTLPPDGWHCPRDAGHEGPCAALQVQKYGAVIPITEELLHDSQLRPCDIKNCPHCPVPTPKEPVSRRTRLRWWVRRKWNYLRLRAAVFLAGDLVVDRDLVDDWDL